MVAPLVLAQSAIREGRAVPERNQHLTLAFFEDVDEAALEGVDAELRRKPLPQAEITVTGWRSFGVPPRLIAAEVEKTPELDALHVAVHQAIHRAGVRLKSETFLPHITLRRFRKGSFVERVMPDLSVPGHPVEELALWQSTLAPRGARYDVLATYGLGA